MKNRNAWRRYHWIGYAGRIPRLRELTGTDWRVYLLIDAECRRRVTGCTLSNETAARELHIHPRTFGHSVAKLRTLGLVFSLRRPDMTSVRVAIDPLDSQALRRVRLAIDWHERTQGPKWGAESREFLNRWRDRIHRRRRAILSGLPLAERSRASMRQNCSNHLSLEGGHSRHPSARGLAE